MRTNVIQVVLLVAAILTVLAPRYGFASEVKPADLPLGKVVLFNSGVGFFEHSGKVNGEAKVELKFNVEDVNDLLKSMVLEDRGGGRISTITYGSRDPITKTLKTFSINLTGEPTLANLLRQVRGERLRVSAPNPIEGKIIGVEMRKRQVGHDQVVETEVLNLLSETGLRSIPMDSISETQLVDDKLNAELNEALGILALGHTSDKKIVTLRFIGQGERPVRIGYIQESPVWKTSYRLVLKENEAPFLQGWAIVENTTEQDWNDVHLTLVSGRPISFIMDLYQPLYAGRPMVTPELFSSLRPQRHGQDLANRDARFNDLVQRRTAAGASFTGKDDGVVEPAPEVPAPAAPAAEVDEPSDDRLFGFGLLGAQTIQSLNPRAGVEATVHAEDVGELFRYEILEPVTLARQQSALIPIANDSLECEKISIYNPQVQSTHPLVGVQLKNTTNLHLMQGPITVFDEGIYAGDAQIEDLAPNATRLVSYALDVDTEVGVDVNIDPEQTVSIKIVEGTITHKQHHERHATYTVKNSGKKTKKVLIEQRLDSSWTLKSPEEPTEKTQALYRFAVEAKPGEPAIQEVTEEQVFDQLIALTNTNNDDVAVLLQINQMSSAVRRSLEELIKRRQELAAIKQVHEQVVEQVGLITQEQDRIRQNMAQLDRPSELYKRYVKKFGEQEDEIERLRTTVAKLNEEEIASRKVLADLISSLSVD